MNKNKQCCQVIQLLNIFASQIERILGVRLQAGLRTWTQVLLGQADDKAEVDMDTDAPQVSHKPGGEPKIKVSEVFTLNYICAV